MPKFRYTAIDKQGKELKGLSEAASVQAALEGIREKGFFPVKVVPAGKNKFFISIAFAGRARVKRKTLTVATRQLATLLGAGLPLVRALKIIEQQQSSGPWKKTLIGLIEAVEAGSSFSDALGRYPNIFSRLYISMVRAGESAGVLDVVLARLAEYFEKSQKLRGKVISALIYPCLVLGFALIIVAGLMIFVVPKFAEMFADMGVPLPYITTLLISISRYMLTLKFWLVLIGIIVVINLLFKYISKFRQCRYILDRIKIKLPVIGKLIQKIVISRFARTLGTLVSSGVPILQALTNVKEAVDNEVVGHGLEVVHDSVKEGESIVEPLKQCAVFDSVVINMVGIGEETGRLDEMLIRVADTYDGEVDLIVAGITSILEPVLIIALAVIIGFIVISLFLPLISLLTSLTG